MTFREVMERLYCNPMEFADSKGFDVADYNKWIDAQRIPLIHIPEVARIIGCKPSDIDDYFVGKDHIIIDWSSEK